MTAQQIETAADPSGLCQPDIDLQTVLRQKILPEFIESVGFVSWRRRVTSLTISAVGGKSYDLPEDFGAMKAIAYDSALSVILNYIGDDPAEVMAAAAATTPAKPSSYYLGFQSGGSFRRIFFNATPDATYVLYYVYYINLAPQNLAQDFDLDAWIPRQYQWAVVDGLKAYLYGERYGLGDRRAAGAKADYLAAIMRASSDLELSSGGMPKYAG